MTPNDWNRSQAKQMMIDHMNNGTPLPDVMIDDQLHIFFARVGPANDGLLMTRAQIMMGGEQDPIEANKQLYREAYRNIQRAMKEHAKRLGFGRHHADESATIPATIGNGTRRTNRERDRQDDRRSLLADCDDSTRVTGVSRMRDEERKHDNASRDVPTRTSQRKCSAVGRRRSSDRRNAHTTTVQRAKKTIVKKSSAKRSTVAPTRRR